MNNTFDDMREAVEDARTKLKAADNVVGAMASMCAGRLRNSNVSPSTLERLKKELADYNIHTNKWKRK